MVGVHMLGLVVKDNAELFTLVMFYKSAIHKHTFIFLLRSNASGIWKQNNIILRGSPPNHGISTIALTFCCSALLFDLQTNSMKQTISARAKPIPRIRKMPPRVWGRTGTQPVWSCVEHVFSHHFWRRYSNFPDSKSSKMAMVRGLMRGESEETWKV